MPKIIALTAKIRLADNTTFVNINLQLYLGFATSFVRFVHSLMSSQYLYPNSEIFFVKSPEILTKQNVQ